MNFKKTSLTTAISLAFGHAAFAENSVEYAEDTLETTTIHSKSIKRDAVIETIDIDSINANQFNDTEDLTRYIPGVNVSKGDDRWGSSGFNIRGLDEDRVSISVDGVPQGETLKYEGGQAYGYFKGSRNGVDIEALKQVQIVKGADAILAGSGSLSGSVNMVTKNPDDLLEQEGDDTSFGFKSTYAGANNEVMGSFSFANRFGDLETMLIYTQRDSKEYKNFNTGGLNIQGSGREIPDPQDRKLKSLLAKVIYQISEGSEIGLVASHYDRNTITDAQSFNGGWYSNRIGNDTSETKRLGLFYHLDAQTPMFDRLEVALNNQSVDFEAKTTQHVEFDLSRFRPGFLADEDRVDTRSYDQDILQFTLDLVKTFDLGEQQHELTYGLEWQDKNYQNIETRDANSNLNNLGWVSRIRGALVPKSDSNVKTLYALDTFNINNAVQFRLGARYDDISYNATANENFADPAGVLRKVNFSAFSWTFGSEFQINDNLAIEAGVSTGFRAPTIEELYVAGGTPDNWTSAPNTNLKPEYATNYDVALVGETDSLNYRVGVFFSDYKDFIENRRVDGTNPTTNLPDPEGYTTPSNVGGAEIKGLELAISADLSDFGLQGFKTSFQAAYTDGKETDGDPIYSVQPFNAVWSLGYIGNNWGTALFTSFTTGKEAKDSFNTNTDGSRTSPLYLSNTATVIDLHAYYNITENVSVRAGINNITDKEYFLWDNVRFVDQSDLRPGIGVRGNGVNRYSEPGRNFELGLNVNF